MPEKGKAEMSLLRHGKALALTIYVGESDQWRGEMLYVAIVQMLREARCAGATVTRAIAGFGAGKRLYTQEHFHLVSDATVIIQVVDRPERLERLLPQLEMMTQGGLITLHEVEVLKYTHARSHGLSNTLPVQQIMETAVVTVSTQTPVAGLLPLLIDAQFRALPVVDGQRHLVGIIGTRDLVEAGVLPLRRGIIRSVRALDQSVLEALGPQHQAPELTANEVMNRQVRTISPEASVKDAAQRMLETPLRVLPVVSQEGKLVGMLSRSDLLQLMVTSPLADMQRDQEQQTVRPSQPLREAPVSQQPIGAFPLVAAPTVETTLPLVDVLDALLTSPLKRVFVVNDQGQVQGVISDVDVLARLHETERPGFLRLLQHWTRAGHPQRLPSGALRSSTGKARVAADVMNPEVVTVDALTTVQETIERMMETHRKVLPVVDSQHRIQGVVSRADILRLLLER
jgi:CBS-domain-containing membrane protein